MRLLSGMLAAQKFDSVMTGDASLSKRPMERIAKPLREMGAQIQTTGERGTPPVSITGNQSLTRDSVRFANGLCSGEIRDFTWQVYGQKVKHR